MWSSFVKFCFFIVMLQNTRAMPKLPNLGIINGKIAQENQFPHQVFLLTFWGDDILNFCSGSLISTTTVLTAAQCVKSDQLKADVVGIYYGCPDLTQCKDVIPVEEDNIKIHPNFNYSNGIEYDIAAIILPFPLSITDSVKPIDLDFTSKDHVGETATLAGWGELTSNATNLQLQYAEAKVISNKDCSQKFPNILDDHMCTSPMNDEGQHVGICGMSDIGSALITNGKQIGIASQYDKTCNDASSPSGYTRVSKYEDWLKNNII